jgi:hypothetical protein
MLFCNSHENISRIMLFLIYMDGQDEQDQEEFFLLGVFMILSILFIHVKYFLNSLVTFK